MHFKKISTDPTEWIEWGSSVRPKELKKFVKLIGISRGGGGGGVLNVSDKHATYSPKVWCNVVQYKMAFLTYVQD